VHKGCDLLRVSPETATSETRRRKWITARCRSERVVFLLFGLLFAGVCLWQFFEHRRRAAWYRGTTEYLGRSTVAVLERAVQSVGRQRRARPEFFQYLLDGVVRIPGVKAAWLFDDSGLLRASAGMTGDLEPPLKEVTAWLAGGLLIGRRIETAFCFYNACNEPQPRGPSEPAMLFLLLDRTHVDGEVRRDASLRLLVVWAAGLMCALGFLLFRSSIRGRQLAADLALSRERSRRNEEWALAGAGFAHETKNPLSVIRGRAQQIAQKSEDESVREDALALVEEVDRVVARIDAFLRFMKPREPAVRSISASELLQKVAQLVKPDVSVRGGRVAVEAEPIVIEADEALAVQILLNLAVNGAQWLQEGGTVTLRAARARDETAFLEVEDEGAGIAPEELSKVFDPYYSRRPGGTGLGLTIARRLAELHGWTVTLSSTKGRGTRVKVEGIRIAAQKKS